MGQLLVVDDEPHVGRVVQISFERRGWTVSTAATLDAARTQVSAGTFDVIFLDVKLPDGSGLEFLAELRDDVRTAKTPVVVLSGAEFEDVSTRVAELGGAYMAKPFSPTKLLQLVESLIDAEGTDQ